MAMTKEEKQRKQAEAREKLAAESAAQQTQQTQQAPPEQNPAPAADKKPQPPKKAATPEKATVPPMMQAPVMREGREYAQSPIQLSPDVANSPIPEPRFDRPTVSLSSLDDDTSTSTAPAPGATSSTTSGTAPQQGKFPFAQGPKNPSTPQPPKPQRTGIEGLTDTSEADEKEKKRDAANMAEVVLFGYSWLCDMGYQVWNYDENKLNKEVAKGKIDPAIFAMEVQIDEEGTHAPLGKFISDYNLKLKEILTVDDEFKKEARPLLVRVFMKNSVGMSDEWRLAVMFGADAVKKIIGMSQLKASMSAILKGMTAQVREMRKNGYAPDAAPVPEITQPGEKPSPPEKPEPAQPEPMPNVDPENEIQTAQIMPPDTLDSATVREMQEYELQDAEHNQTQATNPRGMEQLLADESNLPIPVLTRRDTLGHSREITE